jgi:hypothetical protein
MNTEQKQAIAYLEECIQRQNAWCDYTGVKEMRLAIEALREKAERENPKPLTLEELKKRVGKPVFLVHKAGGRHWDVLTKVTETTEYGKTEIRFFWRGMSELGSKYYPEWIQYYDHEPKEAQNEH